VIEAFIKAALRAPVRQLRKVRRHAAAARLRDHEHATLRAIGAALIESLSDADSDAERSAIAEIEERRSALLASDRQIAFIDFGAGSPDSNRSEAEMQLGVNSTELVSKLCLASKPRFWAHILFKLIRNLQPTSCIELGSCVGISAAYISAALDLNGDGRLLTLEGAPEIAEIAQQTLAGQASNRASVVVGPFQETFEGALSDLGSVDFFFNDGHHDHDAVLGYFEQALPHLGDEAVVVIDDIRWSGGMLRAWRAIEDHGRVAATIDLGPIGISVLSAQPCAKQKFTIRL